MSFFTAVKAIGVGAQEIQNRRNHEIEIERNAWNTRTNNNNNNNTMGNPDSEYYPAYSDYKDRTYTAPPSIAKSLTNTFLRFLQFVFALTVAGLYGQDLHHACDKNVYLDAKWVYAEIVAALAAATAAMYILIWCCVKRLARPALTSYYSMHLPFWLWEIFMCLMWMVLFGIFGKLYLPEDPEGDLDIVRMRHAAWIDLVNLLLWTATMVWSGLRWWQGRARGDKKEKKMKKLKKTDEREAAREQPADQGGVINPADSWSGAPPAQIDQTRTQPSVRGGIGPTDLPSRTPSAAHFGTRTQSIGRRSVSPVNSTRTPPAAHFEPRTQSTGRRSVSPADLPSRTPSAAHFGTRTRSTGQRSVSPVDSQQRFAQDSRPPSPLDADEYKTPPPSPRAYSLTGRH